MGDPIVKQITDKLYGNDEPTYKIVRFFEGEGSEVIDTGLTLEEAQEHCRDPETSSRTATSKEAAALTRRRGQWFDGYEKED